MTVIQFFVALRTAIHVQADENVVMDLAFKQASNPTSFLRIKTSSCTQHNIASNPPSEILAEIFGFTLKAKSKYHYDPHSPLLPFLMVNKWWSGAAYRQLYCSISMHHRHVAKLLYRTLSEDPQIAALVIELRVAAASGPMDVRWQDYGICA